MHSVNPGLEDDQVDEVVKTLVESFPGTNLRLNSTKYPWLDRPGGPGGNAALCFGAVSGHNRGGAVPMRLRCRCRTAKGEARFFH